MDTIPDYESRGFSLCVERFKARIKPEPKLLVSEWSDLHRILPSKGASEPGPWRTSRTPYLREILDALSTGSPFHTVVFAKGSQIGASEAGLNWLGYAIHHAPAPMLMVQPTLEMVKRISKQRIQPMIDATPALAGRIDPARARDAGNTLFQKDFPGGTLIMTGANSATGLRSMPARYLFLDEVDAYPGDVEGEGDPVDLATARTSTFKRNRKIFMCSTPTIRGMSRIWTAFERTDQRYYFVPCPECDGMQKIEWSRITWRDDDPSTAGLVCEQCGVLIEDHHKPAMLARGEWRATAESSDRHVVGFHLSSLYSPPGWYSWSDAVSDFMAARGHPTKLQSFVNTKLGETWEDSSGEAIDDTSLMSRREQWPVVPADVVLLTAGADVQNDRIEITIIGWTAIEQARVLHHYAIPGNPGEQDVWRELDAVLLRHYESEAGPVVIRVACIDSGGHHTKAVYEFCQARAGRRVYAIKGRAGAHPIWAATASKRKLRHGTALHLVGVDTAKDAIHSALAVRDADMPRYVAFSSEITDAYFHQLTIERRVTEYNRRGQPVRVWKKPAGARNEALDCFVYALAALESMKSQGLKLKQVRPRAPKEPVEPAAIIEPAAPRPAPPPRRKAITSSAIL